MTFKKLMMLSRLNFRSNRANNTVYVLIFTICITLSLITIYCSLIANFSIDSYLNHSEDGIRYRQFILKTYSSKETVSSMLNDIDNIQSIQYNLEGSQEILITTNDYGHTDSVINYIQSKNLGTVFRKTEDMIELSMINNVKYIGSISLFFVAIFIIIVLKTNISHSIEEREFEIALYISTGYTEWVVSTLLFVENIFLLIIASIISHLLFSQINNFILTPQIHQLSMNYLNVSLPASTNAPFTPLTLACIFISIVSILLSKSKISKISPSELLKS